MPAPCPQGASKKKGSNFSAMQANIQVLDFFRNAFPLTSSAIGRNKRGVQIRRTRDFEELWRAHLQEHTEYLERVEEKCRAEGADFAQAKVALQIQRKLRFSESALNLKGQVGAETTYLLKRLHGDIIALSPEETKNLAAWTLGKPFDSAPWDEAHNPELAEHVKLYRSAEFDAYVDEALQHQVQGKGMGMTQQQLFAQIREGW